MGQRWAGVLLTAVVAVLVAPVQMAAGAAVAAAATGAPVLGWCWLLALLTALRIAGQGGGAMLLARGVGAWGLALSDRFRQAIIEDPRGDPQDLERARSALAGLLRSGAELAGVHGAALLVLLVVDARLAWCWAAAGVLAGIALRRLPLGAFVVEGRPVSRAPGDRAPGSAGLARGLGLLAALGHADADHLRQVQARRRRWSRGAWRAQVPTLVMALAQAGCAVAVAWAVAAGRLGPGAAVTVILVTTTAAARSEGLAALVPLVVTYRSALRRLRRLRVQPLGEAIAPGPLPLVVGGVGAVAAGESLVVRASAWRRAELGRALAGAGGLPVVLGDGRIRPGTATWERAVLVVPVEPLLAAGPLCRQLDPMGRHTPAALAAILQEVHLGHLVPRLGEDLGPGGAGLSGGERRRIALAAALIAQPAVVVVDDLARGLDGAAAAAVQAAWDRRQGFMTRVRLEPDAASSWARSA